MAGEVTVNGQLAQIGMSVDPEADVVQVRGRRVTLPADTVIYKMNKPAGYVTTVRDPQGRKTVMDLLPAGLPRLYPVGRLDRDTEGLLLMTNDGELTQQLLHPSKAIFKRYRAHVRQLPAAADLARLAAGIELDDGPTLPCRAWIEGDRVLLEIQEGRKRQVRRMLAAIGSPVDYLQRVSIGPIQLGRLALGQVEKLTGTDEKKLRSVCGC